jgi:hypothetical protein
MFLSSVPSAAEGHWRSSSWRIITVGDTEHKGLNHAVLLPNVRFWAILLTFNLSISILR